MSARPHKPHKIVIHHIVDGHDDKRRLYFATREEADDAFEKLQSGTYAKTALRDGETAEVVSPIPGIEAA